MKPSNQLLDILGMTEDEFAMHERTFDPCYAHRNTDGAEPQDVLLALGACADCHEKQVRLVGSVRAGDIVDAVAAVLKNPEIYRETPYVKLGVDSRCPNCGNKVQLLQPRDMPEIGKNPSFYVCGCGFIGQIGVGPVSEYEGGD